MRDGAAAARLAHNQEVAGASPARATNRLYGRRWQKARATFLLHHPLCAECAKLGRTTAATVVDHIVAHRGDVQLFWDKANWQPLCAPCHDRFKQSQEKGGAGFARGCGADGVPRDPRHHWR